MEPDERVQAVKDKAKGYVTAWAALLAAAYVAIGKAAGDTLYRQWQADGLLPDTATYEAAANVSDDLDALIHGKADNIASTTHDRLDSVLSDALAVGTTAALLAALQGEYSQWTGADASGGSRADVIGGEANGAWSAGQNDAASVATITFELVATHTWNAVLDNRTRDAHAEANGQTVALGQSFDVGGESLAYPGDPAGSAENTLNCRCFETIDGQPVGAED